MAVADIMLVDIVVVDIMVMAVIVVMADIMGVSLSAVPFFGRRIITAPLTIMAPLTITAPLTIPIRTITRRLYTLSRAAWNRRRRQNHSRIGGITVLNRRCITHM
jgi:hypothetical protein